MKDANVTIPENVEKNIQAKSKLLSEKLKLNEFDLEDIEQELRMEIIKNISKHEDRLGSIETFCDRIIKRKLSKITRTYYAGKNIIIRRANHLTECNDNNDDELYSNQDTRSNIDIEQLPFWEALNLRRDFSSVLSRLPEKLKRFCQAVIAEKSLNSAAKSLGLNKHSLYKEYITPLRKICSETNLKDYLDKSRPFRELPGMY
ncbi:MAG: hypothetical protein WC180_07050 [Candidatus Paceibacterota bacterium]